MIVVSTIIAVIAMAINVAFCAYLVYEMYMITKAVQELYKLNRDFTNNPNESNDNLGEEK